MNLLNAGSRQAAKPESVVYLTDLAKNITSRKLIRRISEK